MEYDYSEEQIPIIKSLDDLQDERAKRIARQYKLDFTEILPLYTELDEEFDEKDQIKIDTSKPNTPINIHRTYIKKFASAAIISYELSKRPNLHFYLGEDVIGTRIGSELTLARVSLTRPVSRISSAKDYEDIGERCENTIEKLVKEQQSFLSSLQ